MPNPLLPQGGGPATSNNMSNVDMYVTEGSLPAVENHLADKISWAGCLLVGALDGCPASFPWLCDDHPMDGTLKTLNRMFSKKLSKWVSFGWIKTTELGIQWMLFGY
ncbi:hypothetical protein PGTUg99_034729 [Puccinia graminis f. sp. tritici]|uniref:Uncharacterized protein n=1 Tax=Puccinia graminis f. sp. tritici TaxID=56615 RepID=A0A5B0RGD3_PUCGR|nr:hypothetical protein PGTUg99_034729 [Puccinia graminis f. sp. tritici]